jgi:sugar phosphate isomerase/epimerase
VDARPPAVGLYSNGVRGLRPEEFLYAAAAHGVPFVHLRGGPRGYGMASIPAEQVTALAWQAACAAPVTLITADVDLSDFVSPEDARWQQAGTELASLAQVASEFGAGSVRVLARAVPSGAQWQALAAIPDPAARHSVTMLIELHDPAWFTPKTAERLCELMSRCTGLGLLLDSGQVHDAWLQSSGAPWASLLSGLIAHARVVHLSDRGCGLDGHGHRLLASAARDAADDGHDLEVAFEWTGADRCLETCMTRYGAAVTWWEQAWRGAAGPDSA